MIMNEHVESYKAMCGGKGILKGLLEKYNLTLCLESFAGGPKEIIVIDNNRGRVIFRGDELGKNEVLPNELAGWLDFYPLKIMATERAGTDLYLKMGKNWWGLGMQSDKKCRMR